MQWTTNILGLYKDSLCEVLHFNSPCSYAAVPVSAIDLQIFRMCKQAQVCFLSDGPIRVFVRHDDWCAPSWMNNLTSYYTIYQGAFALGSFISVLLYGQGTLPTLSLSSLSFFDFLFITPFFLSSGSTNLDYFLFLWQAFFIKHDKSEVEYSLSLKLSRWRSWALLKAQVLGFHNLLVARTLRTEPSLLNQR